MGETISIFLNADDKNLSKALDRAKKNLANFEKSAIKGGKGIGEIGKGAANAVPSLTSFSQVIQDAPFGIRGVANNITQLTSQFGYLVKSTGGAKSALKAMVGALTGPAGILLAVSAVTSFLVAYGDKLTETKDKTNELLDATKDLIGGARSQLTTIQSLLSVARDQNRASDERQRALNKINDLSKGYTKSLTLENLETSKSIGIINKYSEALIRQAKIKGLQNRISDLFAKQYELENKALSEQIGFTEKLGISLLGVVKGQKLYEVALAGVSKAQKNQTESLKGTNQEIDLLRTKLGELVGEDTAAEGIFSNVKQRGDKFKGDVTKALEDTRVKVQEFKDLVTTINPLGALFNPLALDFQQQQVVDKLNRMEQSLVNFNNNAANLINNSLFNTFSQLGQIIGDGLTGGANVLEGAGKILLGAIGGILTQLGRLAIQTGVGLLAVKTALKSLNPAVAIAAGTALVALGRTFSSKAANIGSQIGSGFSGSRSSIGSGDTQRSGTITSFNSDRSGGQQQVVFIQRGEELYGVLQSYVTRNQGLGTNLSLG